MHKGKPIAVRIVPKGHRLHAIIHPDWVPVWSFKDALWAGPIPEPGEP